MFLIAAGNPFVNSYLQSDWFGKWIFWGLFLLSGISWAIIIHKAWLYLQTRRLSNEFISLFSDSEPLDLQFNRPLKGRLLEVPHPFFEIYKALKQKALAIISRNHFFSPGSETCLSEADLDLLESQVEAAISEQSKKLEKNLFILSTIVTLGPFLGLLGTVWGILLTFSQLHAKGLSTGNAGMLSGLSLALATTVIGLVVAIPALVGYNYLKNAGRELKRDMDGFSHRLLIAVELHYRKPDHAQKTLPVN
jgi:biopolymer transport protein TolQ